MFERFKKVVEIHHKWDIIPQFDYANCTEKELREFFKTLTRIQLIEVNDRMSFDDIKSDVDFYKVYYEVIDWQSWPVDEETSKAVNALRWDKGNTYDTVKELVKQVEGMQTKLDKIETLIANAEFKLCGKDALKL